MSDFKNMMQSINKVAEVFKGWAVTIDWKALHERMEYLSNELPTGLEQESVKLMNRGWFIWFLDGSMSDFSEKMHALVEISDEEQDAYMRKYIEENLGDFESELCNQHPSREPQIKDAFRSHAAEIYYASIPTFLALSEGIGRDLYPGIGIFEKQRRNSSKVRLPKTDNIFDSISGLEIFEESVLKPLRVVSDVTRTINSPTEHDKKLFNRHLIIHGNSNLYGCKDNSLKAISLTFFVHKSLGYLKNGASI
jgi:hypothetical protein